MKNKKNKQREKMHVNIISDCDAWHSYESMRVICVVDDDHLVETLERIQKSRDYTDQEMEEYIHVDDHVLNDPDEI